MFKKIIYLALALSLTSCAQSSGVLKMGPDTYSVSVHAAPARGGATGSKKLAINEAGAHCTSLGKEILVSNISTYPSDHLAGSTTDITFLCLSRGDIELRRPQYENTPDTVIEVR